MSRSIPASPRIKRIQRIALTLLVTGGAINYIDRATLAIANPLIRQDLGLSLSDMGLLLSVFLWAYAFAQLPAGGLIDRFGPRRLLGCAMAVWSVAQAAAGFTGGLFQFAAMRVVLGVGEAPQFPTAARVVRDWFHVRDRGTATGIWNSSSTLGTAISAPLLTVLMLQVGWRGTFMVTGVAGLIVAALWYGFYRDPGSVALTEDENNYRTEGDITVDRGPITAREWRRLFRSSTTWGMSLGFFGLIYLTWVYTAWLPGYLEIERHMSIRASGFATALPFVAGIFGSLSGGKMTDWLVQRKKLSPINSRKYPMVIALTGMALFTVLAAFISSNVLAIACISSAMFLGYAASSCAWAMTTVVAPAGCTASLGAIQNCGGYIGGALAAMVTGYIAQSTGTFVPALLTAAAIGLASAIIYLVFVRSPITFDDPNTQLSGGEIVPDGPVGSTSK